MKLTKQELNFLKSIKNQPFTLRIDDAMDKKHKPIMNTAEKLEDKGLCNTSFTPSKGYSARITDAGREHLKSL